MTDSQIYNLIPVFDEMRVDFETPVSIFMKVKAHMLLESVEKGENVGRFSIIAVGKRTVIQLQGRNYSKTEYQFPTDSSFTDPHTTAGDAENPLVFIREYFKEFTVPPYLNLPPFFGGAVGYLGYETHRYFENIPIPKNGDSNGNIVPDGLLVIPEVLLVYDSVKRTVFVIVLTRPGNDPDTVYRYAEERIAEICRMLAAPVPTYSKDLSFNGQPVTLSPRTDKPGFLGAVKTCKDHIFAGDIIQAVISQKFDIQTDSPPFELYRSLRILNPSPYMFYLDFDNFYLIGSSPEVMVRVQDNEVLLKPIAGTRKRGQTVTEDTAAAEELLADPKERAEHLMLVDLGRNDLGRVAVPGSVRVTDFMKIEKFSHVMHIVSTIKAELAEQYDSFDVIRACFPAGTLTGAPKIRAMEIIAAIESEPRGPYGGMIFNMGFNGNMDSCITIRTIILRDRKACVQVGAGIVADSLPENEYEETMNKAQALIKAIELAR